MEHVGRINIRLEQLIKRAGLSKNKLCQRAEMQRTQLNNYCNNNITLLDINVLARICTALQCDISDLLEFIPYENQNNDNEILTEE